MSVYSRYDIPPRIKAEYPRTRLRHKVEKALGLQNHVFAFAPSGYGKTTCLTQIARSLSNHPDWHVAWLHLRGEASADSNFDLLDSILESLAQSGDPAFEDIVKSDGKVKDHHARYLALANGFAEIPGRVALFIDGTDCLFRTEFPREIATFAWYAAANTTLFVSGRYNPGIMVSRLKANERLTVLDESDFAFSDEDIISFFGQRRIKLSKDDAKKLLEQTSGWVIALRMLAVLASEAPSAKMLIRSDSALREWALEYLAHSESELNDFELKRFARKMSMLECFDETMASHVMGGEDIETAIRALHSYNIIVRTVDAFAPDTVTYKVNPLFIGEIRERAFASAPKEELKRVGDIALEWLLSRKRYERAITLALELGQTDTAFHIVEDNFYEVLARESSATLSRWLDEIPFPEEKGAYYYCIAQAWTFFVSGRTRRAVKWLGKAEVVRDQTGQSELKGADTVYNAVKVGTLVFSGKYKEAIALGTRVVSELGGGPQLFLRATILHNLAEAYVRVCRYDEAYETFVRARIDAEVSGRFVVSVLCTCEMATILGFRGKLDAASNLLLKEISNHSSDEIVAYPGFALLWITLARIYYYWGNLERAQSVLNEALPYLGPLKNRDMWIDAQTLLAQIKMNDGYPDEARDVLIEVHEMLGIDYVPRGMNLYSLAVMAECNIILGDYGRGKDLLREMSAIADPDDVMIRLRIAYLDALIDAKEGNFEQARRSLNETILRARTQGLVFAILECTTLLACVLFKEGREDEALDNLAHALHYAMDESIICVFEKDYPSLQILLYRLAHVRNDNKVKALERVGCREYAEKILKLRRETQNSVAALPGDEDADTKLPQESLSARETEIYELLKQGKTRKEISEELDIRLNTVRTHVRNIYRKTGIHDRSKL